MGVFGSDMTVQAAVDRTAVHPGDVLTVKVWIGGQMDQRVQAARVELACKNRYRKRERDHDPDGTSNTRTVTREETIVAVWQPLPGGPEGPVQLGEHTVTLQVPPDAPPTVHEPSGFGDVVKWEVRAILDRRMGFDPDATIPVYVASFANQYAHWAGSPPVPKSHEVPMMLDQLSTRVLRPGEQITGVLHVQPRESAKARTVRVQLERRRTDTPDNMQDTQMASEVELARDVKLEAGQTLSYPFQIPLPENSPPTFAAAKSYMHWFLEGIVDRKMRSDFVVEAEVVVYTGHPDAVGPQPAGGYAAAAAGAPGAQPAAAHPAPGGQAPPSGFPQSPAGDFAQPETGQPVGGGLPMGGQPEPIGGQPAPQPIAAPMGPPGGSPSAEAAPGSYPADWYPDPWLHARLRYWDGNAWTGHTAE
jgi:sporulation-control protein spo0M